MVTSSNEFAVAVKEAAKKEKARRKKELPTILKQFEDRIQEELARAIHSFPEAGRPIKLCLKDGDFCRWFQRADVKAALKSKLAETGWKVAGEIKEEKETYTVDVEVPDSFTAFRRVQKVSPFSTYTLVLTVTPLSTKEE